MKRLLERLAVGAGLARLSRRSRRGRTLVLAYHNVVPAGEAPGGDRSLHLPQEQFARHLEVIGELCDVVAVDEILQRPAAVDRPRVAITFDDAYAGAVTAGADELVRRHLPGVIFVVPGFLGGRTFWWDELADPVSGEVAPQVRDHAIAGLGGCHDRVLEWSREAGVPRRTPGPSERTADEGALARAAGRPGINVGAHTWSHPNLVALEGERLANEVSRPLAWLRAHFPGAAVPWLSYPYGLENEAARGAVAAAGYHGALRVDGGWMGTTRDLWALPRFNVPAGLSLDGFLLRLSGLAS